MLRARMRDQLERLIEETLQDELLSRGEKRDLKASLKRARVDNSGRAYLRNRTFALARQRLADPALDASARSRVVGWLENVIKVLLPESQAAGRIAEAYFSPGVACRERICRAFREARTSADVCVFTITDNDISQEIARAHARGLRVRIITDNDKSEDRGSDIDRLRDQGVPVRVDETEHHMHHKFAVFDSELLFTGSYNWTRSAASHNQENIAVTSDRALVVPFVDAFELLWKQFTD